jgi:hypothetical protein
MGWFSRKRATAPDSDRYAPTEREADRYKGRPLLILIENYVLHAIGCLPPEKIERMAAAVQRQWGGGPDWCATVREVLDIKDTLDDNLRAMWERNQVTARESGETLTPDTFARMIADVNFLPAMEQR